MENMTVQTDKLRVLIVDDETSVRTLLSEVLQGQGYEVVVASSGEEAVELARKNPFEIVITDMRMPGISGVEAVTTFQREYPTTPVIILTGFPDVALAVDFMKKNDVVDYLTKPVEKDKLIAAVEQAAQGRKLFG